MAHGIRRSILQTEILGHLQEKTVPSVTALSEAIDKPRPSVSRSLRALADQGLVERQGRSWHITDAGKTVAERAISQLTETTEEMIELAGHRFNAAKRLGHGDTLASILGKSFDLPDESMSQMLNGTLGVTSASKAIGLGLDASDIPFPGSGLAEAGRVAVSDLFRHGDLASMGHRIGLAAIPSMMEPSIAALNMSRFALPDYPNISKMIGLSVLDAIPMVDSTLLPITLGLSAFSDVMNSVASIGPDTETLAQSIAGVWSDQDALQGFLQQSAGVWDSVERVLDSIKERIKKNDALRSMGIDTDRLRIAGVYDWLSHVSDAIDRAESEEGGTAALIDLAKSEMVTEAMFALLNELPENVRELRVEAIRQALDAHGRGHFIAAISTLVAQLDGLIGDFLVAWQRYKNMPENRLRSMRARIENLDGFMDPNGDYPSVITPEDEFANPRNHIAHGDPEADYSEIHSTKHIFLVLSLLSLHLSSGENGTEIT